MNIRTGNLRRKRRERRALWGYDTSEAERTLAKFNAVISDEPGAMAALWPYIRVTQFGSGITVERSDKPFS